MELVPANKLYEAFEIMLREVSEHRLRDLFQGVSVNAGVVVEIKLRWWAWFGLGVVHLVVRKKLEKAMAEFIEQVPAGRFAVVVR